MKKVFILLPATILLAILGVLLLPWIAGQAAPQEQTTSGPKYNAIAMPLDAEQSFADLGYLYNSQGLLDYIGSSASQVLRLNASRQDFDSWFSGGFGVVDGIFTTTPFPLNTGEEYWILVNSNSPTSFSVVGEVPAAGSVDFTLIGSNPCKYNGISIPLDQSEISNAVELSASIGNIEQVLRLNTEHQDFDTWFVTANFGIVGGIFTTNPDDFPVKIGYPYWVCVNTTGNNTVWPMP
ncbi:MAG TPA: hypothetical protein DEH25_00555 [Chloroflexi bacterium]|nr:hypothetical protein [Chloroflexota bacterium]